MPRNKVINRRNITSLKQRSLSVSDAAVAMLQNLAAQLNVSQGSMFDTALLEFSRRDPAEIAQLLHLHGHLTDEEFVVVAELAAKGGPPSGDDREDSGMGGEMSPEGV